MYTQRINSIIRCNIVFYVLLLSDYYSKSVILSDFTLLQKNQDAIFWFWNQIPRYSNWPAPISNSLTLYWTHAFKLNTSKLANVTRVPPVIQNYKLSLSKDVTVYRDSFYIFTTIWFIHVRAEFTCWRNDNTSTTKFLPLIIF